METAKNIVSAASNMVFGENQTQSENTTGGQEPVAGETGAGTANKPYDAGNVTGEPSNEPTPSTATEGDPANTEGSREPKSTFTATSGPDVGAAAPDSGAAPQQKQQGADRPNEEPTGENAEAVAEKKADTEEVMEKDADDESGEPLGENKDEGQKNSMGSTSKEPGTGTQYVKTSGMAAEGGDFDATKPGAGREADRLLEEKGVHREGGNTGPPQDVPGAKGGDSSNKPSLGQKIKDKLHIGKNKE